MVALSQPFAIYTALEFARPVLARAPAGDDRENATAGCASGDVTSRRDGECSMRPTSGITGHATITSKALEGAIEEAMRTLPDFAMQIEAVPAGQTLTSLGKNAEQVDVLLVEVAALDPATAQALGTLAHDRGDDRLTLVSAPSLSLADVRHLHRLGVFDVVPQPVVADDVKSALAGAVQRLAKRRRSVAGLAPVIAFTRAKGGMGATTLATHVALSMAGAGRRKAERRRVALLDLDIQFGDAAINLDVTASPAVVELIMQPDRLDATTLREAMTERADGVSILAAPSQLLPLEAMDVEFVGRMIDLARHEFDVVVVDLPIAIPAWTQAGLARTNELVMGTALSVSAIRRTRRLLELLAGEGELRMHVSIALNRYTFRFGQRGIVRQSEATLGRSFDFKITNDYPLVAQSQDRGTSVYELKPRAQLSRDCHHLADVCLAIARRQGADGPPAEIAPLAAE